MYNHNYTQFHCNFCYISRAQCNTTGNRPPFSFSALILRSIRKSSNQRLTLHEILESIMEEFPYYREITNKNSVITNKNWQNNVRHKLTVQSCFQKISRKTDALNLTSRPTHRPGHHWIVDPKMDKNTLAKMERSNHSFYKCYYCDFWAAEFDEIQDHMKSTHEEFSKSNSDESMILDKKTSENADNLDDEDNSILLNCGAEKYMEENEMFEGSLKNKWENRPPYSFSGLIIRAIQKSPEQRLTLREIYDSITNEFPYYR